MMLLSTHCRDLESVEKLSPETAEERGLTKQIDAGWGIDPAGNVLSRQFDFSGFDEVMLFANYIGWLSTQQDHHPRMTLEYKTCFIEYHTHSVAGLSIKDFICAAHIDWYLKSPGSS